jgi:glycosyltransferase involved in cell wall biosynthesis
MRIIMMTNTYLPHVGGLAQSVLRFTTAYRERGHRVLVVAPYFENQPKDEDDVVRIPAVQNVSADFPVSVPVPFYLMGSIKEFQPDIIHSHHPFLIGETAMRVAAGRGLPIVYTHHTMYEHYTHYAPVRAERLQEFIKELGTCYANRADHVIAPSESVAGIIRSRGVTRPITVIPTGLDVARFEEGDGAGFRRKHGVPEEAAVIGFVGRLAPEKNLEFLARAAMRVLRRRDATWLVVVGHGESEEAIRAIAAESGMAERVCLTGALDGQELVDAYHAFDLFAFFSKSETQGMVVVEAMAAGTPVVALNAPGVREVVEDGENGCLLEDESEEAAAGALLDMLDAPEERRDALMDAARRTAREFDAGRCAEKALALYDDVLASHEPRASKDPSDWRLLMNRIAEEWRIWRSKAEAASAMYSKES